jgi:hypothetical protein
MLERLLTCPARMAFSVARLGSDSNAPLVRWGPLDILAATFHLFL